MPEDGFFKGSGSAVVQKPDTSVDLLEQTKPPERSRPPFPTGGSGFVGCICEPGPQIMEKEVGIGTNALIRQLRRPLDLVCAARGEGWTVAGATADLEEELLSLLDRGILRLALSRRG